MSGWTPKRGVQFEDWSERAPKKVATVQLPRHRSNDDSDESRIEASGSHSHHEKVELSLPRWEAEVVRDFLSFKDARDYATSVGETYEEQSPKEAEELVQTFLRFQNRKRIAEARGAVRRDSSDVVDLTTSESKPEPTAETGTEMRVELLESEDVEKFEKILKRCFRSHAGTVERVGEKSVKWFFPGRISRETIRFKLNKFYENRIINLSFVIKGDSDEQLFNEYEIRPFRH